MTATATGMALHRHRHHYDHTSTHLDDANLDPHRHASVLRRGHTVLVIAIVVITTLNPIFLTVMLTRPWPLQETRDAYSLHKQA